MRALGPLLGFSLLLGVAAPRAALAQANYDGVKLGGRTAIMGGAGVARGSDGATAFINPAGIIRIPGESFTFGTFAVEGGGRSIDGFLDPAGRLELDEPDAGGLTVRVLPNTFCLFLDGPLKDRYSGRSRHKFGVCGADTETDDVLFTRNASDVTLGVGNVASSHSSRVKWARSTLALAWGFELQRGLQIGVAARLENSRLEDQTSATAASAILGGSGIQSISRALQSSSWDAFVVLGVQHQVSRLLTLGASLSTPSQHVLGYHTAFESFAPAGAGSSTLVQDSGDFRYNQPSNLRLGLAFSWPRVNVEINGSYYGIQEELASARFDRTVIESASGALGTPSLSRASLSERAKPVMNVLAGAEFFLDPDYSVLVGVQTDFSALENRQDQRPADTLFRQRKDAVHASIGAATYGKAGSLLLGLKGFLAGGEILMADAAAPAPSFVSVSQSEWGLSLVVAGQISFESVRDTAARATRPLKAVPSALESTPAKEAKDEEDAP